MPKNTYEPEAGYSPSLDLLSYDDVAKLLRMNRRTVENKISRGEIIASKTGGEPMILRREVDRYILRCTGTPAEIRQRRKLV